MTHLHLYIEQDSTPDVVSEAEVIVDESLEEMDNRLLHMGIQTVRIHDEDHLDNEAYAEMFR